MDTPWKELYTKRWTKGVFESDPLDGMILFVPYEGEDADEYDEDVLAEVLTDEEQ